MTKPEIPVRAIGISNRSGSTGCISVSVAVICQDEAGNTWHFNASCPIERLQPGFPEGKNEDL